MGDPRDQLAAIERTVQRRPIAGEEGIGVVLRRRYDAPVAAVWAALTEPGRVARWFLPVSGDLRVGGSFQTEGNAGGEILRCEPPQLLQITWGGPMSVVEISLDGAGEAATMFEFIHTVPLSLAQSGAGALFVGPGWDSAVTALGRYLAGEDPVDPAAAGSPEFNRGSVDAWVATIERSGTATADELAGAAGAAMAQWAPES